MFTIRVPLMMLYNYCPFSVSVGQRLVTATESVSDRAIRAETELSEAVLTVRTLGFSRLRHPLQQALVVWNGWNSGA
jgi:hypothetical protein